MVLGALRQMTERDVLAGRVASQVWNDIDMGLNHVATRWTIQGIALGLQGGGVVADATGVGVVVGVPLHIAGAILSGVDLISRLVTKSASIKNVELRLAHIALSIFAYEAALRGALVGTRGSEFINGGPILATAPPEGFICRITSTLENHGCASGLFCKREFVFLPTDAASFARQQFSPNGLCAPLTKAQHPVNGPCLVHSDCATGYCGFNKHVVRNAVSATGVVQAPLTLSAANGYTRGDEPVKAGSTVQVELSLRDRQLALSGVCLWARSKNALTEAPPGCAIISANHQFFACNDRTPPSELETRTAASPFLRSYAELRAARRSVDDSVIDTSPIKPPTLKRSQSARTVARMKAALGRDLRRLNRALHRLDV